MHPNNYHFARLSPAQFDLFAQHFEIVSMSTLPDYVQIVIHFRLSSIYVTSKVRAEAIIIRDDKSSCDDNSSIYGPRLVYSNHALLEFFKEHKVELK